jgi:hypothetical protein
MSRDYWMTRRKAPIIDKLKQTITLQDITTNCGPSRGSLYITRGTYSAVYNSNTISIPYLVNGGIAVDAYLKIMPGTSKQFLRCIDAGAAPIGLTLYAVDGTTSTLRFTVRDNAGTQDINFTYNYLNAWHRYTLVYDDSTGTGYCYIDNQLVATTSPSGSTMTFANNILVIIGVNINVNSYVNAFISEVRVWNKLLTQTDILATTSYRGTYDETNNLLAYYVRTRSISNVPVIGAGTFEPAISTYASVSTTEYPPLIYGSSFVVAKWPVTLPKSVSLQWPITMPENTTGVLCVTWTDSNGIFQRRKLWSLDGVDLAPQPETYRGENVSNAFVFELWNIDGASSCGLTQNIVLGISSCTNPTTSYDKTQQAAIANPTPDTTLAEGFPLTPFPLQFNEQQTY